jgi:hypothetical protein
MSETYENTPPPTNKAKTAPSLPSQSASIQAGTAVTERASSPTHVCNCRSMTTKATNNGDLVNEALKNLLGNSFPSLSTNQIRATLNASFRKERINGVETAVFQRSPVDMNSGSGGKVSAFQRNLISLYKNTALSTMGALQALQPVGPNPCCPDAEYEGIKKMMRALLQELGTELQRAPSRNDARIEEIFLLLLGDGTDPNNLWQTLSDATNVPSTPKKENEIEADNNLVLLLNELAHLRAYWNRRAKLEVGLLAERDDIQQNLSVVSSNLQNFIDDCDAINLEAAERGTIIITDPNLKDPDMSLEELLTWLSETVDFNIPTYLDTKFSEATKTCIDVLEKIKVGFSNLDKTILPPSINNVISAIDGLIAQLK